MHTPFAFGKTVSGQGFTNRKQEISRLTENFRNQVHTILISPRRWGKSSLVRKAGDMVAGRKIRVVYLDVFSMRNEEDFYTAYATEIIKATSGRTEEWIRLAKNFFKRLTPKFSMGIDPINDFEISFEIRNLEKNYKEIINLPERIAAEKKIKLVVCIDEFQNINVFRSAGTFQKRLRAEWQQHKNVTYCLYGSKQHMMIELFESQSMPFYKFGEVMHLKKIGTNEWVKFITGSFKRTGKLISTGQAEMICKLVNNHSYYVQQLSHITWSNTNKSCTNAILLASVDDLLAQNSLFYEQITDNLSSSQINFIKAVAGGISMNLSSKDVIREYDLGTSANVLKIKNTLLKKEIIDIHDHKVEFLDPAYELWVKKNLLRANIGRLFTETIQTASD